MHAFSYFTALDNTSVWMRNCVNCLCVLQQQSGLLTSLSGLIFHRRVRWGTHEAQFNSLPVGKWAKLLNQSNHYASTAMVVLFRSTTSPHPASVLLVTELHVLFEKQSISRNTTSFTISSQWYLVFLDPISWTWTVCALGLKSQFIYRLISDCSGSTS